MQLSSAASLITSTYKPTRRLTRNQVESARRELERRRALGEENVRIIIAENVPRRIWETSSVSLAGCRTIVKWKSDCQFVDIELVDVEYAPHSRVVNMVHGWLGIFACSSPQGYLVSDNARLTFQRANRLLETREPDATLNVSSRFSQRFVAPRLVIEVVVQSHSLPAAQQHCREYFEGYADIRAVVLIKFWPTRQDGSVACVAVSYRRDGNDVDVADVVSFGSVHLCLMELAHVENIDEAYQVQGQVIRDLTGAGNVNAKIRISDEDLYFEAPAGIARIHLILPLSPLLESYTEGVRSEGLQQIAIEQLERDAGNQ